MLAIIVLQLIYDTMRLYLHDIVQDVKELDSDYSVEFHLGGYWKFLAMVTGID